jgi:hypothetical protein
MRSDSCEERMRKSKELGTWYYSDIDARGNKRQSGDLEIRCGFDEENSISEFCENCSRWLSRVLLRDFLKKKFSKILA